MGDVKTTPHNFVYTGKRRSPGGLAHALYMLDEKGGFVGEECVYEIKPKTKRPNLDVGGVVGGIYVGAEFSPNGETVRGLANASWTGKRHPDKAMVATWEAKSTQVEMEDRLKRMAAKVSKDSAFDDLTIGELRAMVTKALDRGDFYTASALRVCAAERILKRATKAELEELHERNLS